MIVVVKYIRDQFLCIEHADETALDISTLRV